MKTPIALIAVVLAMACSGPTTRTLPPPPCPVAPVAETVEKLNDLHDVQWSDPYYWLRERENPKAMAYLEAENAFAKSMMAPTEPLQKDLYDKLLSHVNENELSAPYPRGEHFYYWREEEGKSYRIHCRKFGSIEAEEQIILDENELAAGGEYFALGALQPSPDGRLLAYSTDHVGDERYKLHVINLDTREVLAQVDTTYYGVAWANDNRTLFFTRVDAANRPYQLHRFTIGDEAPQLVYEEADERFFLGIDRARSGEVLVLNLRSKVTTEVRFLDANKPTGEWRVIAPRTQNIEYSVEHHSNRFYIVSNENAVNFRLFEARIDRLDRKHWKELIPERPDVTLRSVDAFKGFLAIWERSEGLARLRIRPLPSGPEQTIAFPEAAYALWYSNNFVFDTTKLRITYSSLVTPQTVFDIDVVSQEHTLIKQKDVPNYDASQYETARAFATAADGTQIPISLVWRKGTRDAGPAPLLLIGYGSYGASYDPSFSSHNLAYLDRGLVVAIAHIRGGGENGRKWYEAGKYLNKPNTFSDFIASAEHLIADGWTTPEKLAISGRSAGGLLIGAVINMRPELFRVALADVPFVDVINTMLDPTIPLTVIEWEEWGNPADKVFFDAMRAYSPYDNVKEQKYPHMLVTAGLNDRRVAYWEPAKWVARLRATAEPGGVLLFRTNMGAGHGGASGRYDYLRETAMETAFVLRHLGIAGTDPLRCGP